MNPDAYDLVRTIEAERHAPRRARPMDIERPRTRRRVADSLRRLATRIDV
jgi:hypothetical protein